MATVRTDLVWRGLETRRCLEAAGVLCCNNKAPRGNVEGGTRNWRLGWDGSIQAEGTAPKAPEKYYKTALGNSKMTSAAEEPPATISRKLSFSVADEQLSTTCPPERLQVFVRVRPLGAEHKHADMNVTEDSVTLRTTKSTAQGRDSVEETSYTFDGVFNRDTSQSQVFERAMLPQVRSLLAGRDTLTFAYGITNAGKTHTIQGGSDADKQGMLPRAMETIFAALEAHSARASGEPAAELPDVVAQLLDTMDASCSYEVRSSFLEVYGNDTFDLLAPPDARLKDQHGAPKRATLRLKEDRGQVSYSLPPVAPGAGDCHASVGRIRERRARPAHTVCAGHTGVRRRPSRGRAARSRGGHSDGPAGLDAALVGLQRSQ